MRKLCSAVFLPAVFAILSCRQVGDDGSESQQQKLQNVLTFADAGEFSAAWSRENKLVVHLMSDPSYLHPAAFSTTPSVLILQLTHGRLLQTDLAAPRVLPGMVKSLPLVSSDRLRYTYELLDEAQWDDGSPVTAADVIFTLKALKCRLVRSPVLSSYTGNVLTVISDSSNAKKFTLVMKRPYVQNESFVADIPLLSHSFFDPKGILSGYTFGQLDDSSLYYKRNPELIQWAQEFNDGKFGNDPSFFYGCGPYKVIQWERGQSLVLQRKENHWTQKLQPPRLFLNSYPEQIIFKIMKDEHALELEFKSQTFDATNYVPTKVLVDLQRDSSFVRNYNSAFLESYSSTNLVMNTKPDGIHRKKIFDDLRVRRALALLVPVDQIIRVAVLGKATRWPCIVSPLRPDFNGELTLVPYDPNEAALLLEQAGWRDTDGDGIRDKMVDGTLVQLEAELLVQEQGNLTRDLSNMIAESAAKAGFRIEPRFLDQGTLAEQFQSRDFDAGIVSWSFSAMQQDFTQLWHTASRNGQSGNNYSGFGNAESDALIDSIKFATVDSLRYTLSKRLQKLIYDEQPCVFMYSTHRKVILHRRWGNQSMYAEFPCFILNNLKLLGRSQTAASFLTDY